ncbi:hypothetical protein BT96DRAFT_1003224 [Gymnopus androsaceus JB14]|uniref:Uncharacterized protein n=1 Tax=Gymnopus androsaceus JB14 TaxID=1447944 RepID=A0A6A4GVW3_9AGAR|nr:hypothetical protein BT96DRAFT_1003224 [Gymnopus androsaceus JB14]
MADAHCCNLLKYYGSCTIEVCMEDWDTGSVVILFGKAKGDFIMHRECGTLVDLNPATNRAIGKMKTEKGWKAQWYKVFYIRDKLVMVGPPTPDATEKLAKLFSKDSLERAISIWPLHNTGDIGHPIEMKLPTWRNDYYHYYHKMYKCMGDWLEGKDIDLEW